MFYIKRIFYYLLFVVFFECNFCNPLSAYCCVKENTYPQEVNETEILKFKPAFCFNYFSTVNRVVSYIHDLYCREKGFFYKFFLQQYTTSRTYYLCWTFFEHVLKKFLGVVWIYKTWKAFEFYYGSVVGVGWYPQFLIFSKNFRMGFFDIFINFLPGITTLFHIFLAYNKIYVAKESFYYLDYEYYTAKLQLLQDGKPYIKVSYTDKDFYNFLGIATPTLECCIPEYKSYAPIFMFLVFLLGGTFNISVINIKMFSGLIRLKFLTLHSIAMFFKSNCCSFFANILKIAVPCGDDAGSSFYIYCHASAGLPFFFKERDNIPLPILEALIPNIEINIGELFKK